MLRNAIFVTTAIAIGIGLFAAQHRLKDQAPIPVAVNQPRASSVAAVAQGPAPSDQRAWLSDLKQAGQKTGVETPVTEPRAELAGLAIQEIYPHSNPKAQMIGPDLDPESEYISSGAFKKSLGKSLDPNDVAIYESQNGRAFLPQNIGDHIPAVDDIL